MLLRKRALTLASMGLASFVAMAASASAAPVTILSFTQTTGGTPVTAVTNGANTVTTITGTNIATAGPVENAGFVNPMYLNFSFTSTGAASTSGPDTQQNFSGTFSFYGGPGLTGTNYLTGSFTDLALGTSGGTSLTLSASTPTDTINFSSSVITTLDLQRSLSFSFTSQAPPRRTETGSVWRISTSTVKGADAPDWLVSVPAKPSSPTPGCDWYDRPIRAHSVGLIM